MSVSIYYLVHELTVGMRVLAAAPNKEHQHLHIVQLSESIYSNLQTNGALVLTARLAVLVLWPQMCGRRCTAPAVNFEQKHWTPPAATVD